MASVGFDVFWTAYPRKVCKKAAEQAWAKIGPDPALATAIVTAVYAQRLDDRERQFIPYPASWLNGERWADEVRAVAGPARRNTWRERCPHGQSCGTKTQCAGLTSQARGTRFSVELDALDAEVPA